MGVGAKRRGWGGGGVGWVGGGGGGAVHTIKDNTFLLRYAIEEVHVTCREVYDDNC